MCICVFCLYVLVCMPACVSVNVFERERECGREKVKKREREVKLFVKHVVQKGKGWTVQK